MSRAFIEVSAKDTSITVLVEDEEITTVEGRTIRGDAVALLDRAVDQARAALTAGETV